MSIGFNRKISKFYLVSIIFIFAFPLNVYAIGINSCQIITEPNSYNTMTQDVSQLLGEDCIVIAAENVTLDCRGYSITSKSTAGIQGRGIAGIYSDKVDTTIKSCNVSMGVYSPGIFLVSANNSYIFNNTLNHQGYGIFLIDVHNALIEENTANFNGYAGIKITTDWGTSSQNTLIGNTANGNYNGIWINKDGSTPSRDTLIWNNASDNSYIGIVVGGSNNTIEINTADNNSYAGIYIAGSDNTIRRNNANRNSQYGIYVLSSSLNNNLRENRFCFNSDRDVYCTNEQRFTYNWCDLSGDVCGGTCLLCSEYRDVCVDGTVSGDCSIVNPPLYCDSGYLVFDLNKCRADAGKCCQSVKNPSSIYIKRLEEETAKDDSYIHYVTNLDEIMLDLMPRGNAIRLAANVPIMESCDNGWKYFNETMIDLSEIVIELNESLIAYNETANKFWRNMSGSLRNKSFYEVPGIAKVIGGYPTYIMCEETPFDVKPPKQRAGRQFRPYTGVRYKTDSCIFTGYGDDMGGKQNQIAILDWNYSKDSYCVYEENNIVVKEISYPNITLYSGWNLISLPLIPIDSSIDAVMRGCDYNKIWAFESDQSWKSTDTGLTSMDVMHGYWVDRVELEGNCEIAVKGTIPDRTNINVYSPWTLVGYPSVTSGLIMDVMPGVSYDKIWAFESDQSWKSTDTGLMTMKYGKGYWIDSTVEESYNVTN